MIIVLSISISYVLGSLTLGIFTSLFVAIIVEIWKRRRERYHLSVTLNSSEVYVPQNSSGVVLSVEYGSNRVDTALVILSISIKNDGKNDIMFRSRFSDDVRISCEGFRFISAIADESAVNPNCVSNDDGDILLSWDILKKNEKIDLNLIAQSDDSRTSSFDGVNCFNHLSFDFRSDCIDSIVPSKELTNREISFRQLCGKTIERCILSSVMMILLFLLETSMSSRFDISYSGNVYKNATIHYSPLFNKYYVFGGNLKTKIISIDDVQTDISLTLSNSIRDDMWIGALMELVCLLSIIFTIVSLVMISVLWHRYRRDSYDNKRVHT